MAALTVSGSSCRRNSGHRSTVPPAKSMRVGARASTRSGIETPGPRPVTVQDGLRVALRLERHEDARLPESVDRERVQDMADVGRKAYGDAVELQDALDELGFEVAPGSVHDDGHGFVLGLRPIIV